MQELPQRKVKGRRAKVVNKRRCERASGWLYRPQGCGLGGVGLMMAQASVGRLQIGGAPLFWVGAVPRHPWKGQAQAYRRTAAPQAMLAKPLL